MATGKRESPRRRSTDFELFDMAREAQTLARDAAEAIRVHTAVCEQRQLDIIRRLGVQDKILYAIALGVGGELLHLVLAKVFGA